MVCPNKKHYAYTLCKSTNWANYFCTDISLKKTTFLLVKIQKANLIYFKSILILFYFIPVYFFRFCYNCSVNRKVFYTKLYVLIQFCYSYSYVYYIVTSFKFKSNNLCNMYLLFVYVLLLSKLC